MWCLGVLPDIRAAGWLISLGTTSVPTENPIHTVVDWQIG